MVTGAVLYRRFWKILNAYLHLELFPRIWTGRISPREGSRPRQELAQQFLRWRQQHSPDEPRQPDQEKSGTSTAEATAQHWEALFGEFVRWREQHPPAQRPQIGEDVFEEVLRTLGKR